MYHFSASVKVAFILLGVALAQTIQAQNYTTTASGAWATASNWSNTSGWGGTTPSTTGGHTSGTATVNHNMTVTGNYSLASATLLINAGKSVLVTGNLTLGGGGTINVYGTLEINGDLTLNSYLYIYPGGQVIVHGNVIVNSDNYLNIGTSTAPPPYADLIVYQNLVSNSSGDITVNRNGRVAVFGNVTATGGGTVFTINNGGQVYVHGNVNFTGNGSSIVNNNTTSPYGLYVNGTVTNSGGGSTTTANQGNKTTMQNTNPGFYGWVQNIPASPLPIELIYFKGELQAGQAVLTWATASEKNFYKFVIEYALNGQTFEPVGEVVGSGIDSYELKTYTYHTAATASKNYYRLKSIDQDGSFEYSPIVLISRAVEMHLEIYPNPAVDYITIQINFDPGSMDHIQVVSQTGLVVATADVNSNKITIQLDQPQAGVYLVQYKGSLDKTARLVIKGN
ncbi:MAG: T9SS type A sorting domain-containing protein [Cyclobacteriaceae bacterium]|nr:T9SS type A sorting domain-containing protein [Cyclobacteriaceae bacterium]